MSLPGCRAIAAATILVLAGACSPPDAPVRDVKGGDGALRLSLSGEPRTLNPNLAPLDEYALLLTQNLFSRLVTRADDGAMLPELAERWTTSPDGLAYTFYLRKDVRFHDGVALTSADVRSTFSRIAESSNTELALRFAGIETPDPYTVTIKLKAPWAAFIPSIAWYGASILPSHIYGSMSWKDNPANTKPIGSGPFKFRSWEPGKRIVFEKNAAYFGQGPYVDALEYVVTRSPAEGVQLLLDRRVDFVMGRPPTNMLQQLSHTPGVHVSMAPSDGRTYLAFNVRRAPFNDLRLRRAVNIALDRRALIESALAGLGTPAYGFYTPAVGWAYNGDARVPPFDPDGARRLIKEIAPPPVMLAYAGTADAQPTALGLEIIRQLERVGLRVQQKPIPPTQLLERLFAGLDFDMVVLSGTQGPDPDTMTARFGSRGSMQVMGYSNPELDRVLARGSIATDPAARAAEYFRAQAILAADLPIAPLFETIRTTAYRDGLRGLPNEDARGLVPDYTFNLVRLPKP